MDFILSNVVSPVVALFRDFLLKKAVNTIYVADNVMALHHKSSVLKDKYQTVKNEVEAQERGTSKKCTAEVQGWLKGAEGILSSSQAIQEEYEKRNCMLGNYCSLNLCSNYSISARAIEVHQSVEEALKFIEGKDLVAEKAPPPVQEMSTATVTDGQLEVMREKALTFIRRKEGTEGTLGIWGMGGVGKTTLLQHINNSLKTDNFVVIFVVASSGCTEEKLQRLIADNQGIPKDVDNVSKKIFEFLVDKDFVLLVDDLWEPLNLEEVGIPLPLGIHEGHNRKVILTTRLLRVCTNMGSGDNVIDVKRLEWDESWALFRKNTGEGFLNSSPYIAELAEDIVRECDGHPLALITVGQAMSQNDTIEVWEDALEKLRTSRMHEVTDIGQGGDTGSRRHKDPISLLKVSYDYLNTPRLKECFLHCALWPEDCPIERGELIECWMGHGFLWHDDEFNNIGEVYREGQVTIDRLLKACLLENVEEVIFGHSFNLKNSRVKMHDLTRDMALWLARDCGASNKKWQVLTDHGKEEASEEAHKISIFLEGKWKLNPRIGNWPHLTTLILQNLSLSESDFASMKHCPLLTYLDVSHNYSLVSFPMGVCRMDKLEYLNMSYTSINSIPDDAGNLLNLKFLILRETSISSIPYGMLTNLERLLVLDISEIYGWTDHSEIIDQLEYRSCPLKALGISVCTSSGFDKLFRLSGTSMTSLSIKYMENLSTISLLSDDFLGRPHMRSDLKVLAIISCRSIEHIVVQSRCRMGTERLILSELIDLKQIIWTGVQPKDIFPKLRYVTIYGCYALEHASWVLQLPSLEILTLSGCDMLECIVGEEVEVEPIAFRSIRYIEFEKVPKLRSICKQESAFPSLESLIVRDCPALKKLPFSSDPASYGKLHQITGEQEWWDSLELQDNLKEFLQPRFNVPLF